MADDTDGGTVAAEPVAAEATTAENPQPYPATAEDGLVRETAALPPAAVETAIEGWWNDHFPGSPVARVTEVWNHAFAAKEDLKRRLAAWVDRNKAD